MATVGFIGLGSMGQAMASRLIERGHEVLVWNRSPEPVKTLVDLGATAASSPEEVLATGMSFSMLANDHAAEDVLTPDALTAGVGVHANMASVSPDCAGRLAEAVTQAGLSYVAAPVLGRPMVAAAGKLNILAAGPSEAIEQADPYFSLMGVKTWLLGDVPQIANVVKVAVNYNIIHALEALSESIAMIEAYDVKALDFVELLTSTLFGGVVYQGYGNLIAKREYLPAGFTLDLGLKDLGLAESVAHKAGTALPTAATIRAIFQEAIADPALAGHDWSAIAEVIRSKRT